MLKCIIGGVYMRTIPNKETLAIEFKSELKKLHDNDLMDAVIGLQRGIYLQKPEKLV